MAFSNTKKALVGNRSCPFLITETDTTNFSAANAKMILINGSVDEKILAMKKLIIMSINGEDLQPLVMIVIKNVLPVKNKTLKRLLLLFWEVLDKRPFGNKLLTELILVCNSWLNDLNHSNEYIRGITLRLVGKIRDLELIEPLVESVKSNLNQRHSYVRRNAIMAIYSIMKVFPSLIPDAPEMLTNYFVNETDSSCKRCALLILYDIKPLFALTLMSSIFENLSAFGQVLQLTMLEIMRRSSNADFLSQMNEYKDYSISNEMLNPKTRRIAFIRVITNLLSITTKLPSVQFEAAITLLTLTRTPTAVKAAFQALLNILNQNLSGLDVSTVILDKIVDIKKRNTKEFQSLIMEIFRIITFSKNDLFITKKILDMCFDEISEQNLRQVIKFFKKEILKPCPESEVEYMNLILKTIHQKAIQFPSIVEYMVPLLLNYLEFSDDKTIPDIVYFLREIIYKFEDLQPVITEKLIRLLDEKYPPSALSAMIWIIGQYTKNEHQILIAIEKIGSLIIKNSLITKFKNINGKENGNDNNESPILPMPNEEKKSGTVILPDGSYSTNFNFAGDSSVINDENVKDEKNAAFNTMSHFLACSIATNLVKLSLRSCELEFESKEKIRAFALLILVKYVLSVNRDGTVASIVAENDKGAKMQSALGANGPKSTKSIDEDYYQWIVTCIKVLITPDPLYTRIFLEETKKSFEEFLFSSAEGPQNAVIPNDLTPEKDHSVDSAIKFPILSQFKNLDIEDEEISNLNPQEINTFFTKDKINSIGNSKTDIVQLTGLSDPLYVEAKLVFTRNNISVEVTILNQTTDTLQNVTLELFFSKLISSNRDQNYTIGPQKSVIITKSITKLNTHKSFMNGCIVYDIDVGSNKSKNNVVVLDDIKIDMIDYIEPKSCNSADFKTMWKTFEWDTRASINGAKSPSLVDFLNRTSDIVHMKVLTSTDSHVEDKCGFLVANLYAKSCFDEQILGNLSIQKDSEAPDKIHGFVRIRSETADMGDILYSKLLKIKK